MSETVDTRVVEARFDSKQFEQGVNKTVKKLDELKSSLSELTKEKTVSELGNKVQESTEKASNSLEKLQDRFTSFTGMLKQKLLSGIADEIVGVFFKIKSGFENLITSLSSAQVGAGLQRYTNILTSVRTLTAAGVMQDKAYESIERLGEYADQTSYNLDSMVATMSKFKTAGADIDTAARMIEGLSNAAASMGVNAQEAERAYLNLQQAYSKKVMLQNDWVSFESLPMVGTQFNQAIIDAAVKVGTLEAVKGKEGTYKTKKKAGTKIKAASGITADNLGSNLASRWFTDEVMEEVFGNTYYFAEVGIDEVNKIKDKERQIREVVQEKVESGELDKSKFDEEVNKRLDEYFNEETQIKLDTKKAEIEERKKTAELELEAKKGNKKEYEEAKKEYDKLIKELDKEYKAFESENHLTAFAYNAFRAGQEARSFTDVLNTLKDSISRGWAKSFELIFGKLDEASEFFTKLTESKLAEGIYAIGEFRNAVLESWRNNGGRDNLLGVLEQLDDLAGSVWEKFGLIRDAEQWFENHFDKDIYDHILNQGGKDAAERYKQSVLDEANASPFAKVADELGQRLAIMLRDIRLFFGRVKNWFTEVDSTGSSRLQRISNILQGFGTIFSGAMTAVGMGLQFVGNIYYTFKPAFDRLWEAIEKILQPVFDLFNPNIVDSNGMNAYKDLENIFNNISKVAVKLADPLAKVIEIFGDVAKFFIELSVGTITSNLRFFSDAFGLLLEVLGLGSSQADKNKSVTSGIVNDITSLGDACKTSFQAISDFFSSVIADIRTWLGLSEETEQNGEKKSLFQNIENWFNTNESVQAIKKAIDDFIGKVKNWITTLPERISQYAINIGDLIKSLFFEKKTKSIYYDAKGRHETFEWVEKDFVTDIKEWFRKLPEKITNLGISIGDLIKSIFYTKKLKSVTYDSKGRTATYEWVEKDITKSIKAWFKELPEKIKKLGISIGDLFKSIFYTKETKYNGSMLETKWIKKDFTQEIENFVKDIPIYIHDAFVGIGDFLSMVWDALLGKTDNSGSKANEAAENVQESIDTAFGSVNANSVLGKLSTIGKNIWNGILTIFTGNPDEEFNKNWLAEQVKTGIENIASFGDQAWQSVSTFIEGLPGKIAGIFSNEQDASETRPPDGTLGAAIYDFVGHVGTWITSIPDTLLTTWENAEKALGSLWETMIGWITGDNVKDTKLKPKYQKMLDEAPDAAKETLGKSLLNMQWREDNPVLANISDFFGHLKEYIINRIVHLPEDIASGLATGATLLEQLLQTATGWINDDLKKNNNLGEIELNTKGADDKDSSLLQSLSTFGETIWSLITTTIPGFISAGFNWIKTNAESWSQSLIGLFSGGEETVEGEAEGFGIKIANALKSIFKPHTYDQFTYDHILKEGGWDAAARYKDATTNPVIGFFKDTVAEIGKIFEKIGPTILEGINKAFEWIGTQLTSVTGFLNDIHAEGKTLTDVLKEKMIDQDTGEENPLWASIKKIGSTIKNIIVDVIPSFISSAVTEVAQVVPKLFSGLFGGGSNGEESLTNVIQTALTGGNQDTAKSDNTVTSAELKEMFDTINQLKNEGKEATEEYAEAWHKYSDALAEFNKQQNELTSGKTSFFGAYAEASEAVTKEAEEAQKKQQEAAKNMVKREEAIKILKQKLTEAENDAAWSYGRTDKANRDKYVEKKKEANEYRDNIEALEKLKDEYVDLSEFDGSKVEDSLTSFSNIFTVIQGFAENSGSTLAMLGLLAIILTKLRDIFSISDELEAPGYTAKWTGIKAAIMGLIGLILYLVYLNEQGDETKLARVEKTFEKLGSLIERLTSLATVIAGFKAVGEVADSLGTFGSGNGLVKGTAKAAAITGAVFAAVGEGGEILTEALSGWSVNLAETFESIGVGMDDLLRSIEDLASLNDKIEAARTSIQRIGTLFNDLRNLFVQYEIVSKTEYTEFYDPSVADLQQPISTGVKYDYVEKNISEEFFLILRMFSKLSGVVSQFKNAVSTYDLNTTGVTDALGKLLALKDEMVKFAEFAEDPIFEQFNHALMSLGGALQLYSLANIGDLNTTVETWKIDNAVDFLGQIFGNQQLKDLITKVSDEDIDDSDKIMQNAEAIIVFAGALVSIGKACEGITSGTGTNINKLVEAIKEIEPSDGSKISEISEQFGEIGNAIGSFAINTSDLQDTNIDNAQTALTMLIDLANNLRGIPNSGLFAKLIYGDKSITNFGVGIENLGQNLNKFFGHIENLKDGVSTKYNTDNLDIALDAAKRIARIYSVFINNENSNYAKNIGDYFGNLEGVGNSIVTFLNDIVSDTRIEAVKSFDFSQISNFFMAIASIVNSIARSDMRIISNRSHVQEAFTSVTSIIGTIRNDMRLYDDFFETLDTITYDRVEKMKDFCGALSDLAYTLYTFSTSAPSVGLFNLKHFDFDALAAIGEALDIAYSENNGLIMPKITPVIELKEDEVNKLRDSLGFLMDENGKFISPTITIKIDKDLPLLESIDTKLSKLDVLDDLNKKLETLNSTTEDFNTSLSNIQFIIDGATLTEKIGPTMDRWLGSEAIYVVRSTLQ